MIRIKTLEEHRQALEPVFQGKGFLRTDRGEALFISDAPRRGYCTLKLPEGYEAVVCGGMMKVYPASELENELKSLYISVIKADAPSADRLLRQALAVAMRKKDAKACEFIRELGSISKIHL